MGLFPFKLELQCPLFCLAAILFSFYCCGFICRSDRLNSSIVQPPFCLVQSPFTFFCLFFFDFIVNDHMLMIWWFPQWDHISIKTSLCYVVPPFFAYNFLYYHVPYCICCVLPQYVSSHFVLILSNPLCTDALIRGISSCLFFSGPSPLIHADSSTIIIFWLHQAVIIVSFCGSGTSPSLVNM